MTLGEVNGFGTILWYLSNWFFWLIQSLSLFLLIFLLFSKHLSSFSLSLWLRYWALQFFPCFQFSFSFPIFFSHFFSSQSFILCITTSHTSIYVSSWKEWRNIFIFYSKSLLIYFCYLFQLSLSFLSLLSLSFLSLLSFSFLSLLSFHFLNKSFSFITFLQARILRCYNACKRFDSFWDQKTRNSFCEWFANVTHFFSSINSKLKKMWKF